MSAVSQIDEITTLFSGEDPMLNHEHKRYADHQVKYLVPINTNSYNNQIIFDTQQLQKTWFNLGSSYLSIPVKISGVGAAAATVEGVPELKTADIDEKSEVCFKQSCLDLLSGVLINLSGNQIVNSTNQMFYNNLRYQLKHDEAYKAHDTDLCAGLDEAKEDLTKIGSGLARPTNSSADNPGLRKRIKNFKARLTKYDSGTKTLQGVFDIPLKYIHSFFEQCDFPMINSSFQLTFLLNTSASVSQYPVGLVPAGTTAPATDGTAAPKIVVERTDELSEPRLYYSDLSWNASQANELWKRLQTPTGIQKKLYYFETELIKLNATTPAGLTTGFNGTISPSVVAPHRVFICSPLPRAWEKSYCNVLPNSVAKLKSVQFTLNNSPVYSRPLESEKEQYEELQREFSNVGSDICPTGWDYEKWRNANRVLVCNFTAHSKDKLINGNSTASIGATLLPADATAVDYYAIIERKKSCVIDMSSTGTKGVVGDSW